MVENSTGTQTSFDFAEIDLARQLFGEHNSNLQKIAKDTDVTINARGNTVFIDGDEIAIALAGNILNQLYGLLKEIQQIIGRRWEISSELPLSKATLIAILAK